MQSSLGATANQSSQFMKWYEKLIWLWEIGARFTSGISSIWQSSSSNSKTLRKPHLGRRHNGIKRRKRSVGELLIDNQHQPPHLIIMATWQPARQRSRPPGNMLVRSEGSRSSNISNAGALRDRNLTVLSTLERDFTLTSKTFVENQNNLPWEEFEWFYFDLVENLKRYT